MDTGGQGALIIAVDTNVLVESLLLPNDRIATMAKSNTLIAPIFFYWNWETSSGNIITSPI